MSIIRDGLRSASKHGEEEEAQRTVVALMTSIVDTCVEPRSIK